MHVNLIETETAPRVPTRDRKYPVPWVLTIECDLPNVRTTDEGTPTMTSAVKSSGPKPSGPSREEFSERLLKGSVKKSYEPIVDIDWDAPLDPDKFYLPAKLVSLYDTPIWDEM